MGEVIFPPLRRELIFHTLYHKVSIYTLVMELGKKEDALYVSLKGEKLIKIGCTVGFLKIGCTVL